MLLELHVENFLLLEKTDIHFGPGMTVVTGDTGAGKSLIIDALSFVLGERAQQDIIFPKAERCMVSALMSIPAQHPALQGLIDQALINEEHKVNLNFDCLLRRVLSRDGRSKCFINGFAVTTQQLRDLAENLLHLHSQHAQQQLLKNKFQGKLLDAYLQSDLPQTVAQLFADWQFHQRELEQLQNPQFLAEKELLQYQLEELNQLSLQENETEQLHEEQKILQQAHDLLQQSQQSLQLLQDKPANILEALQQSLRLLSKTPESEKLFLESITLLKSAQIEITEACHALTLVTDKIVIDPKKLISIEERLQKIYHIARKHQIAPSHLHEKQKAMQQQLAQHHELFTNIQQLETQQKIRWENFHNNAKQLSVLRQKQAKKLALAISQHLQELGMPGSVFEIQLTPTDASANGFEHIQFMIATNPGQHLQPLIKVVSGGELSRISLAIHVVTASCGNASLVIFDEVDIGVSGHIASKIGYLLKSLSQNLQTICITHLPQIAAIGHHHWCAKKSVTQNKTHSDLILLNKADRIMEIARMSSSAKITDAAREQARILLEESL